MSLDPSTRLSLALSCAEMGAWDWNAPDGKMVWDDQMHALFGIAQGDFDGSRDAFLALIHADDRARAASEIAEALTNRTEYDSEFRVTWPADGSVHFLRVRFRVADSASPDCMHVAGICWDVTERRLTEQQLAAKSNLLSTLMKVLPDHIYFKDRESRFIAVNAAKAARNGLTPEQMTGKTDFDFFASEHARIAFADEQRLIATGDAIVGKEEKLIWPDGHITWASSTKLPLRDEKGEIIGTFGLSRDITLRKQMEEELRAKSDAIARDLEMARELQSALLPQRYPCFPHGAGTADSAVRFHHFYRPSATVSGDFFDTLDVGDQMAGLFICDVMGHGVRAALVAAIMRTLVAQLRPAWPDPARFLSELNAALRCALQNTQITLFASAFYLVADLEKSRLRYANAGHPAPLHIGRPAGAGSAKATPLNAGKPGPALGLFDDVQYQEQTCALAPRDLILLFTDGLFEVENSEGEFYDYQRLLTAASQHGTEEPAKLCEELVREIQQFSADAEFSDDVCLVSMEIERIGRPFEQTAAAQPVT